MILLLLFLLLYKYNAKKLCLSIRDILKVGPLSVSLLEMHLRSSEDLPADIHAVPFLLVYALWHSFHTDSYILVPSIILVKH